MKLIFCVNYCTIDKAGKARQYCREYTERVKAERLYKRKKADPNTTYCNAFTYKKLDQ